MATPHLLWVVVAERSDGLHTRLDRIKFAAELMAIAYKKIPSATFHDNVQQMMVLVMLTALTRRVKKRLCLLYR
jgi:hypothetical protein